MMNFPVKRLVIDSFTKDGHGIQEDTLDLERSILFEDGSDISKKLRSLAMRLIVEKHYLPPTGTRAVHVKTNAHKGISLSTLLILPEETHDTGTSTTKT